MKTKKAEGKKNDFFYFWRNIGRAVEGATARGRWGVGKTVFQAASRINSFYGLTIRRGNPGKLLMGQSVLKIHWCDGSKHGPYGYYGLLREILHCLSRRKNLSNSLVGILAFAQWRIRIICHRSVSR